RRAVEDAGNLAARRIEAVLAVEGLVRRGFHDVDRDRHLVAGQLVVDVAMRPAEYHLAGIELRLPDEAQIDLLARIADDLFIVIFVIFAPIAGAEIADGQEREIVIVRDMVEEGRDAARLEQAVARARPEIGADEIFLARP